MVEKTSQKKPNVLTIIALIISSLGMLLLTLGCVWDWINKISFNRLELSIVNVIYHPISGIISIVFFVLLVFFILEKISPGRLEKMRDYNSGKTKLMIVVMVIAVVSLIILIIDSVLLLNATIASTPDTLLLTILHDLLGIIFGISLTLVVFKTVISSYLKDPIAWEKKFSIIVIVVFIVFLVVVIMGIFTGLIIMP